MISRPKLKTGYLQLDLNCKVLLSRKKKRGSLRLAGARGGLWIACGASERGGAREASWSRAGLGESREAWGVA